MPVVLTRYLYFLDECFHSLLMALINKTSFKEVVFWTGEIYYSGFEDKLLNHIWKIYYDFYAVKFPKYEKKINKMPNTLESFIYILNLLYYSSVNYDVFIMRMSSFKLPRHIYMGRHPNWLKQLKLRKKEKLFIRSLHDKRFGNVLYYLKFIEDDRCYDIIKLYFEKIHSYTLKNKNIKSIGYHDKQHIIMALICHLLMDEEQIQHRTIFRKLDPKIVLHEVEFNEEKISPLYKTLVHKRIYNVTPLMGIFKLERYSIPNIDYKDILRLYWDYFAYNSPLWKARIKAQNGKPIDLPDKYCLEFSSDDNEESFYEEYNYEPDEQSLDVQEKSIGAIGEIKQWLNMIRGKYKWAKKAKWSQIY
jgi:hypothetical protein